MNNLDFVGVEHEIAFPTWMNSTFKVVINNNLLMSSMEWKVGTPNATMTYNVIYNASRKYTYMKEKYHNRLCMRFISSI